MADLRVHDAPILAFTMVRSERSRWADARNIVSNHPFVDGNKRVGLLAAQVFLDVNGITLEHDSEAFFELTTGVAEGRIAKAAVAAELERIAKSTPR